MPLATLTVTWTGRMIQLKLRRQDGLRHLLGELRGDQSWSVHCAGVDDLTPFELAAFLHQAVAALERDWADSTELKRLQLPLPLGTDRAGD